MSKFPKEALNQHIAVLGKTGSGKTYAAKGLVEHLLEDGRRVCIVDPTGAWWGLRSSSDGAAAGFPVVILGGSHGDTGLPAESGAACAQLVADQSVQVIFDTSLMGVGERTRWFAAFGQELFRRNTRPLHLVIDEAHMFAPQGKVPDPDTGKMLHAANTLASGGRSRGIRMMMITQRPAKLHKDSLTCCDTLIAMRVIAPQDREAIEDWVSGNGDKAQSRDVLSSLATLAKGEGWVWAPEIRVLERMKFPKIRTFDSSKTPEDGDAAPAPKTLAEIDLSAITATMTAAVEESRANDPKTLKARIKELEGELAKKAAPAGSESELRALQKHIQDTLEEVDFYHQRLLHVSEELKEHGGMLIELGALAAKNYDQAKAENTNERAAQPEMLEVRRGPVPHEQARPRVQDVDRRPVRERPAPVPAVRGGIEDFQALQPRHKRIVVAIAEWTKTTDRPELTRAQLACMAKRSPVSSSYGNDLAALKTAGWIDYPANGLVALARHDFPEPPALTMRQVQDRVRSTLEPRWVRMLNVLLDGREYSRDQLAKEAGRGEASSSFGNDISAMKTRELIEYPRPGVVRAAGWLIG